jgi:hypothetical protein
VLGCQTFRWSLIEGIVWSGWAIALNDNVVWIGGGVNDFFV